MNGLDWVIAGIGIVCIGRGLWRGAISQVFGILGVLGGFLLATHFYQATADQLVRAFPNLTVAPAISFGLLFLLAWFCIGAVGYGIASLIHRSGLGFLDRLAGGAIGAGKALLLAVVIISVLTLFLPPQSGLLSGSQLRPVVDEAARYVTVASPVSVQKLMEENKRRIEIYWNEQKSSGRPHIQALPPAKKERKRITENEQ